MRPAFRIGQGVDAHRFDDDRPLVLCGVGIPGAAGLAGHSDADVALHAVTDALLGAVAAGDLGEHFPPSDDRWRGAASEIFVRHALEHVRCAGFRVANCDLTLVGETPRIAMRISLAGLLGVDPSVVSVKATTTDGMGFTGRREGLAALATVLVKSGGDDE